MKMKFKLFASLCLALVSGLVSAAPVDMPQRTHELKNLKWGMFVCWSFSTFSGKEWTPGVKDISAFKATGCDTDQWAKTAKEAGMGYILFLTKHHDGFCLWDTKTTERKVTKAPLGLDVLAQLRRSCDKFGIKLALYFSEGEFADHKDYHPGGYTAEMKKAQLKELLTEYGPIEYIWFDHAQTDGGLSHTKTTEWCKQFQPGCFIGYNHGEASGDIRLGEMGHPSPLNDASGAGFGSADAKGKTGYLVAEFTYPILPAHEGGAQWFYSLPKHDTLCLSADKLYADYLGAVKVGNIFSIDVGPDYAGKLRDIDVQTLRKVGEMIKQTPAASPAAPPPASKANATSANATSANATSANTATDDSFRNIAVRFHLIADMAMEKGGVAMTPWITPEMITKTVLPEVNRIWAPAKIHWTLNGVESASTNSKGRSDVISYVLQTKRDSEGHGDPERIKQLLSILKLQQEDAQAVNIYVIPYLGGTSQGNTTPHAKRILMGEWTDKPSHGKQAPEKCLLVEAGDFKQGSFSRTVAHELGHILGLKHPQPKTPPLHRLMGGSNPGNELTDEEKTKVWQTAAGLALPAKRS